MTELRGRPSELAVTIAALPGRYDGWPNEYRVTRYARTDVDNQLPGIRLETPWLPVFRSFGQPADGEITTNQKQSPSEEEHDGR